MIEKTCRINLNFTGEICDDIQHHTVESDRVQQDVTDLNLYNTFLSSIPWWETRNNNPIKTDNQKYFQHHYFIGDWTFVRPIWSTSSSSFSDDWTNHLPGRQRPSHLWLILSLRSDRVSAQCLLLGCQRRLPPLLSLLLSLWWRHHFPHRPLLLPGRPHHLGEPHLQAVCTGCGTDQWLHHWQLSIRSALSLYRLQWSLRSNSRDLLAGLLLRSFLPTRVQVRNILLRTTELNNFQ